ncbi:MAG: tRNA (N6-isopentenyl adenosine(37)-C2)-methylthiotransferase MiaB [Candidatus Omnitrophica bacterium]|nr:tRNA (N6-isopentenyl adenosine(37)-C2)-methylthiotransferase MiaB [Candidatus Omnitrophota bacterium]
MNFRDSEFVKGMLIDEGFSLVNSAEGADVILFNSCSVRKHAEDRLISNIADLKGLKKRRPQLIIGLMGCTAQNHKEKMIDKLPMLDFVCGPGNEAQIPGLLEDILKNRCPIIAVDKVNEKRPELFPEYRDEKFKAFVSIGEGCNNFCSYCIVPYVRGTERSRKAADIIREVKGLAARGFKEVTLLGQNVNSYRGIGDRVKGKGFARLLEEIDKIKGIERIRFMTSHPKDASMELFKAIRDLEKVCEHLHLPMQSGSDRILKMMNRNYTANKYLKLAEDYRKFVPEGSITTDIIVGFPSESRKDFEDTLRIMKRVKFDSAFMFKYSPRPPAKSARLKDDVPQDEKEERLEALLRLQCDISLEKNEPIKGKILEILVDGSNEKFPKDVTGRTRTNKVTVFEADRSLIGKLVNVRIASITPHALKGRIV